MNRKRFVFIFLVGFTLLVGCQDKNEAISTNDIPITKDNSNTQNNNNNDVTSTNKIITIEEAKQIALNTQNGEVLLQREDYDDGRLHYEFIILQGNIVYEFEIGDTGMIQETSQNTLQDNPVLVEGMSIDWTKAKQIAIDYMGGGTVISCHFDRDHNTNTYEIDIVKDNQLYDLEVNADTGVVTEYDMED
jgi:uncharacterized membrane protein YkoI